MSVKDDIFKIIRDSGVEKEKALIITSKICNKLSIRQKYDFFDMKKNGYILLKSSVFLNKYCEHSKACVLKIGGEKIYYTHKDNLYKTKN